MNEGQIRHPYYGPAYQRLMAAARRSLERTGGELDGKVSVAAPDDAERHALIGLTGQHRSAGTSRITVALATLDAAVRRALGVSLQEFLADLHGRPLRNRPDDKADLASRRDHARQHAESSPLHDRHAWYREWLHALATDGTLTGLVNARQTQTLESAVRVLEYLDQRPADAAPIPLPSLAQATTSDTKALSSGQLPTLVLAAFARANGNRNPTNAEQRRELWDAFDVIVDDLASRVLVLNLPANGQGLGEWLTGAAAHGTPFYLTLHQLVTHPITLLPMVVHVCENPAVLRRAAGELGTACPPLVCTEGRPSTAFHRLAHAITAAGGTLRYHGDFDWPGIDIAVSVLQRHHGEPWRLDADDYGAGITADATRPVALTGKSRQTPWDPQLSEVMQRTGRVLYEEAVAHTLLGDLAVQQPTTPDNFTGQKQTVEGDQTRVNLSVEKDQELL